VNLKMQMRTGTVAGIAAKGDELTGRDGNIERREIGIANTRLMTVLVLTKSLLYARREGLQMTVDRGMAGRMSDIDGIAKTIKTYGDTRHVAIGNGIDMLALDIFSLHIETAMKVIGTGLTKVARQQNVIVYWRDKDIEKDAKQYG
jgi:hypothetical protein